MSPLDDEDDGSGDDDDRDLVVLPSSIFYLGIPNLLDTGARWGREIVEEGRPPPSFDVTDPILESGLISRNYKTG